MNDVEVREKKGKREKEGERKIKKARGWMGRETCTIMERNRSVNQ